MARSSGMEQGFSVTPASLSNPRHIAYARMSKPGGARAKPPPKVEQSGPPMEPTSAVSKPISTMATAQPPAPVADTSKNTGRAVTTHCGRHEGQVFTLHAYFHLLFVGVSLTLGPFKYEDVRPFFNRIAQPRLSPDERVKANDVPSYLGDIAQDGERAKK